MKQPIFILLIFNILFSCNNNNASTLENSKNKKSGYEFTIEFVVDNNTFPDSWKTSEINAKGSSLDSSEYERSMKIIQKALQKYPVEVLNENIKKIYILKSMEFYGLLFGGTNSNDIVYIVNSGIDNGYSDKFVEQTFHHEFSSILLRNNRHLFPEKDWSKFNKLPYGEGGVYALKNNIDNINLDTNIMKQGFLCQYAMSDIENDFNTFAENLFCPNENFRLYTRQYPEINNKLNIFIKFYSQINDTFTKDFFETFSINNEEK
jgi:hypothetical protein